MLDEKTKEAIEKELRHYPDTRAACVETLKVIQRRYGWISDEQLIEAAKILEMSPAELEGVATFYNLVFRRPVGKHVVLLCDSVTCWIMGYEKLRDALCSRLHVRLGETSAGGKFTVLPIPCLGNCDGAPALIIDDDLYSKVEVNKLDEMMARYR